MLTVIDTPQGIRAYRLLAIRRALKLEVETGLSHSKGNRVLWSARDELILHGVSFEGRLTKKKALELFTTLLKDLGVLIEEVPEAA